MKRPTTKDVAALAGVSQTAVSFVINRQAEDNLSRETIERIQAAMTELQYKPRNRRKPQPDRNDQPVTGVIGVIVPTLANLVYPLWLQKLEESAAARGYRILICNTTRKPENESLFLDMLVKSPFVKGIVFVFNPTQPDVVKDIAARIPFVNMADTLSDVHCSTIGLNSIRAGEIVAQHLIELGHKHIAYISTPLNNLAYSRQRRWEGICKKMREHHLEDYLVLGIGSDELDSDSAYEVEVGYTQALKILNTHREVTAIIGVNDMTAIGIMRACTEMKLSIPGMISVCGFDNIFLSNLLTPRLTTIDHHPEHKARLAIDIIVDKLEKNDAESEILKIEYEPKLHIRESTGLCRKEKLPPANG